MSVIFRQKTIIYYLPDEFSAYRVPEFTIDFRKYGRIILF